MVVKHHVLGCFPNEKCSWFASPNNVEILWGKKAVKKFFTLSGNSRDSTIGI